MLSTRNPLSSLRTSILSSFIRAKEDSPFPKSSIDNLNPRSRNVSAINAISFESEERAPSVISNSN